MKLYTHRQMKEMFRMGLSSSINEDGALEQFNPIELPSDEEIGQEFKHSSENWEVRQALEFGAKWMRDKIQGGNNEQQ